MSGQDRPENECSVGNEWFLLMQFVRIFLFGCQDVLCIFF